MQGWNACIWGIFAITQETQFNMENTPIAMIRQITGLRPKTHFDTILMGYATGTSLALQTENAQESVKAGGVVMAFGPFDQKTKTSGVSFYPARGESPTLREVVEYYQAQYPHNQVIAICAASYRLGENPYNLFEIIGKTGTGLGFAYRSYDPEGNIDLFVTTSSVTPYLVKDIPPYLTFDTPAWTVWMHNWFQANLSENRYRICADLNLGSVPTLPVEALPVPVVPLSTPEAIQVAPRKRKARRKARKAFKQVVNTPDGDVAVV